MNDLVLIITLTLLIGLAAGWLSLYFISRLWARLSLRRSSGEALILGEEALELLEARGFKIIDRQRRAEIITYIDGKSQLGFVQADFIVSKGDKVYVAEVRAGSHMPDASDPAVRRQFLEYDFVFKPDGIILVDLVEKRVRLIEFGLPEQKTEKFVLVVIGLVIFSVLAGLIWLYIQVKLF